ncbi:hypothetical protein [Serratia symbiotica]|uniref:hypothetical protein n=1 Tax=Serratia symbiotica TaxID=138074 RepID=UPI003464B438
MMQFDDDKICKTFKVPTEVIGTIDEQQKSNAGKKFELLVNGALVSFLNTENASAVDYLYFLDSVLRAVMNDRDNLEREANKSGRTINGHGFSGIGSVSIIEVTDK